MGHEIPLSPKLAAQYEAFNRLVLDPTERPLDRNDKPKKIMFTGVSTQESIQLITQQKVPFSPFRTKHTGFLGFTPRYQLFDSQKKYMAFENAAEDAELFSGVEAFHNLFTSSIGQDMPRDLRAVFYELYFARKNFGSIIDQRSYALLSNYLIQQGEDPRVIQHCLEESVENHSPGVVLYVIYPNNVKFTYDKQTDIGLHHSNTPIPMSQVSGIVPLYNTYIEDVKDRIISNNTSL